MRTAIDTNVLSGLWSGEPLASEMARLLGSAVSFRQACVTGDLGSYYSANVVKMAVAKHVPSEDSRAGSIATKKTI